MRARRALDPVRRQHWHGRTLDAWQVVHEIVQRLELAACRVAQYLVELALRLAGKQRYAHLLGLAHVRVTLSEHRDCAGYMESANADRNTALAKRSRDIERAG